MVDESRSDVNSPYRLMVNGLAAALSGLEKSVWIEVERRMIRADLKTSEADWRETSVGKAADRRTVQKR